MSIPTPPPEENNPFAPPASDGVPLTPDAQPTPPPPPPPAPAAPPAPEPPAPVAATPPPPPAAPLPAYAAAPAAGYGAPASAGTNGMAIASLVLGIIGILSCGYTFFVAPVLAIIFAVIARRQIAASKQGGAPLATTGLILGIIGVVISIGIIIFIIVAIGASSTSSSIVLG